MNCTCHYSLTSCEVHGVEAIKESKNNALLRFMHDTVGKVNNIKSLTDLINKGLLHPDEVKMSINTIGKLADQLNAELDSYYSQNKGK